MMMKWDPVYQVAQSNINSNLFGYFACFMRGEKGLCNDCATLPTAPRVIMMTTIIISNKEM